MSGSHDPTGEHDSPAGPDSPDNPVGSVAEEAAKLFGALAGLAGEHGAGLGAGLFDLAGHAERAAHDAEEPLAPECTWCPVCRTVHLVRQTSPEVRAHLSSALTSLARAAAGLLATAVPDDARPARPGVDHIDLDEDPDGDPHENHDGGEQR